MNPGHPWWAKPHVRLILLLTVLAAVAAYGAHRLLKPAGGHAATACYPTAPRPPHRWTLAAVEHLVAQTGLSSLVGTGSQDMQGPQDPMAAWSDQYPSDTSPHDPFLVPALAGYEIRWWSPQKVHESVDVFVFPTAGEARRYVRQATRVGCRHVGTLSYPIAEPPGGRSLIWDNPVRALQADVFFSRGNRAYRVTVVPPGPDDLLPSQIDGRQLLRTTSQIACRVREAKCSRLPTRARGADGVRASSDSA